MLANSTVREGRIPFEEGLRGRSNFESMLDPSYSGGGRKSDSITRALPIMAAVTASFLTVGLALPVLPLLVHQSFGLGTFVVGLVTGSQFGASVGSRVWSGRDADRRDGKHAVIVGLLAASAAGLYFLSFWFTAAHIMSVTILLLGRAVLGVAESLIITGAVNWGPALVAARDSGRVIAWMGMAMFAALAIGAPIGSGVYAFGVFRAVALVNTAVPLCEAVIALSFMQASSSQGAPIWR